LQVSAQSWHGLAPRDDDRYRIATTADGGIWLLRTPHPEPAAGLAGRHPATDTSRDTLFRPFSIVSHAFTERAEGSGTHISTVAGICLPGA
jgi:hypothetical protein